MAGTIIGMLLGACTTHAKYPALMVRGDAEEFSSLTYRQFGEDVEALGFGLLSLGVRPGDHVGLISDNRLEWILTDLAILGVGAADVPRGSDTTVQELAYILRHAECKVVVVENAEVLFKVLKIKDELPDLKTIVVMDEEYHGGPEDAVPLDVLLKSGRKERASSPRKFLDAAADVKPTDVATIIYTSGTTGVPKGVVLTHANIMHNVDVLPDYFGIKPGHIFMSILPPWHVFERTVEYIILASGVSLAYSKPLRQVLLRDFELLRPHYIASVPRVWEGLYKGILNNVRQQPPSKQRLFFTLLKLSMWYSKSWRVIERREPRFGPLLPWEQFLRLAKAVITVTLLAPIYQFANHKVFSAIRLKTGGRLVLPISGGGALPQHVDEFFDTIGLRIVEGYGLTETSPVVSARLPRKSMFRTVGPPIPFTKVEIRSLENPSKRVLRGHKGIVFVKGPQVMQGYYKNPEATAEVLSEDGWLNTGDIGRLTTNGDIQLLGRAKDTIVLLGGENVEPYPIEAKLEESPYISQAVVVGQDQKSLATLLVPDFEALAKIADERGFPAAPDAMCTDRKVIELFQDEVRHLISPANGFKAFERISQFRLVRDEFKVGDELTHTLKKRRGVIQQKYRRLIMTMYR